MRIASPLLAALGVAAASAAAFALARRAARRWQRRAAAAAAAEEAEDRASFAAALAARGASDRVASAVYDFFAAKETPLDPGGRRPRPGDGLLEDHFITYPEECADVLGSLLVRLGLDAAVPSEAVWEVRTVADVALWLELRAGERRPPA